MINILLTVTLCVQKLQNFEILFFHVPLSNSPIHPALDNLSLSHFRMFVGVASLDYIIQHGLTFYAEWPGCPGIKIMRLNTPPFNMIRCSKGLTSMFLVFLKLQTVNRTKLKQSPFQSHESLSLEALTSEDQMMSGLGKKPVFDPNETNSVFFLEKHVFFRFVAKVRLKA